MLTLGSQQDGAMKDASSTRSQLIDEVTRLGQCVREVQAECRGLQDLLTKAIAFQQTVIDSIAEPIMAISTDYRVLMMNGPARELASGVAEVSESPRCHQISHQCDTPCDGTEHPCPLERVLHLGRAVTVLHQHRELNQQPRFIEISASPLWEADGMLFGIVEVMHDVTERKSGNEALTRYAERHRALATRLAEVTEVERQRLARELHDQVGQDLTVLGINLNIIRSQMPDAVTDALRSRLDDSLSLVEQTAEHIRDVMASLRPPVLDDYGLVAALHWYGEQFTHRTDIPVAVEGEEPIPRLPTRVENTLFRIAQEALTNVAKHAQATQVTVMVGEGDGNFRLVIADDGIGFDPAHLGSPDGDGGWGLLTMAERAEAVGGHCHIESDLGHGTRVIVDVAR